MTWHQDSKRNEKMRTYMPPKLQNKCGSRCLSRIELAKLQCGSGTMIMSPCKTLTNLCGCLKPQRPIYQDTTKKCSPWQYKWWIQAASSNYLRTQSRSLDKPPRSWAPQSQCDLPPRATASPGCPDSYSSWPRYSKNFPHRLGLNVDPALLDN